MYPEHCLVAQAHNTAKGGLPFGVVNALSSKLCFIVVSVCSHDSVAKVKQL